MVCRMDILKELVDDFPENQGRSLMFERDTPSVFLVVSRILEMRPTEIRMNLVLVPTSVKPRIRVGVVHAEPIVWLLAIPRYEEFW